MILILNTYNESWIASDKMTYSYFGITRADWAKLITLLHRKQVGTAWQYLDRFSRVELVNECNEIDKLKAMEISYEQA